MHASSIICGLVGVLSVVTGTPLPHDATTAKDLPGLDTLQSGYARTIISHVKIGFPASLEKRACRVAIVTAFQESSLRILANSNVPESMNIPHDGVGHDHDSVGIFQQRAGWGSVRDRMDAGKSTDLFLRALKRVENWQNLGIGAAAQKVQRWVQNI